MGHDSVNVSLTAKRETRTSELEIATGFEVIHKCCTHVEHPKHFSSGLGNEMTEQDLPHTYRIEYKTFPFLNILSSLLSVVTSWKWAPFSLAKNKSGFHMESNMEGSKSRESSGYSA